MKKLNYVPPVAQVVVFAPKENLAANSWTWYWGLFDKKDQASVNGTIPIYDAADNLFGTDTNTDKPY